MASERPQQSLSDFVAIAINPFLIMALVGSLVFFLVEALLGPNYPGRLLWILFFFVFGAVLVSRVSMTGSIADRAPVYGIVLGGLTWVALKVYVESDWLVNAVLIAIIWWSAHRLTVDSTLIDDKQDASGAGLIQVAGLEVGAQKDLEQAPGEQANKRKREPAGLLGWVRRFQRYRENVSRRPHAPGVWIVYFSLAALPLFGLGQSLIPVTDGQRRRFAFWLMGIYVGSGLGLLLTTSFLNLRRYLRQRNLRMPWMMTGVWLTGGVMLIGILLTVGSLIPRPNAEYPLVDIGGLVRVKERDGSPREQDRSAAKEKDSGNELRDRIGDKETKDGVGAAKDGENKGAEPKDRGQQAKTADKREGAGNGTHSAPQPAPNLFSELLHQLKLFFKWIVGGLVGVVIAFLVLRSLVRFLANFTGWASRLLESCQSWWDRLFGWWQHRLPEAILDEPTQAAPPRPFSAFRDPFVTGQAERMSPAALVGYTFDALQAWAWERSLQRQVGETPLEFVERLAMDYPTLEKAALGVANLYVGVAYARKAPSRAGVEQLQQTWLLLDQLVEQPLSSGT